MNDSASSKGRFSKIEGKSRKNKSPLQTSPRGGLFRKRWQKKETRLTNRSIAVREPCDDDNECCDLEDELCEIVESVFPDNEVVLTIRVLDEGARDFVLVAERFEA